jgi:hypothetical protein
MKKKYLLLISIGVIFISQCSGIAYSVVKNDLVGINKFIDKGGSPNDNSQGGVPLLFFAINADKPQALSLLLNRGADVHQKYECTLPWMWAVQYNRIDCANILLRSTKGLEFPNDTTAILLSSGDLRISKIDSCNGYSTRLEYVVFSQPERFLSSPYRYHSFPIAVRPGKHNITVEFPEAQQSRKTIELDLKSGSFTILDYDYEAGSTSSNDVGNFRIMKTDFNYEVFPINLSWENNSLNISSLKATPLLSKPATKKDGSY